MGFPYVAPVATLSRHDFIRFELQFVKSLLEFFSCQSVRFIIGEGDEWVESYGHSAELSEAVRAGVTLVRQGNKPVVGPEGQTLFLPIRQNGELVAVAVLTGEGENQYRRYSEDWLLERGKLVVREFSLIKRWAMDPVSGVLNAIHLREELQILLALAETHSAPPDGQLILIEVAMRAQGAGQLLQNISLIAAYLDSLIGIQASLHHVGAGVFALIRNGSNMDEAQRFGSVLLRKMKRQGTQEGDPVRLRKVHVAITPLSAVTHGHFESSDDESAVDHLLDLAWQTLETARKRGSFSTSVAADETMVQQHLLAPLAPEVMARLKRVWKGENEFSLVAIQKDIADQDEFPSRVIVLAGEEVKVVVLDSSRAIIYLPGAEEEPAAEWACGFVNRINLLGIGTFSMGVASYPCPGFHKLDMPANAKKALVHTQFFGAGTITSFSGVSLNISGDIYYNEGDLVSAIREYRLGLNLTPDNVNLLNSLGVIYAQLDDYAKAIPLFERAIALNVNDFMALFNLGFAHLCHGDQDKALESFERAEKIDDTHFDLLLQLGQLYCQRGKYKVAVRVLTKAEKVVSSQGRTGKRVSLDRGDSGSEERQGLLGHGLVYRYLGEAYKGIGHNREAMTYLQRAARYNSRDSESLSQLGELYAAEKQGLDIALAFCRQAVEIEGSRASYWHRMAVVLDCREEWNEALEAVLRCLSLDPGYVDALMLKASLYEKLHQPQLARGAYEKVLRLDGTHSRAVKALKKINQTRRKV
ncbi:MAG: tetratricopeptide repeat protein [Proteobacteria bacterium]|nr:tetratricopeptide repeat protein [Desulfobulbaceae bacterium]MBU4152636.1 tetratricopeptide repeat protein [Pseudomonadota bacterium]